QACDSVPPAPGWMERMAALMSCGPESITFSSNSSRSRWSLATPSPISASTLSSPASAASSSSTARSEAWPPSSVTRVTERARSARSRISSCARRLSSQKVGDAISASGAASRASLAGRSKVPPKLVPTAGPPCVVGLRLATALGRGRAAGPPQPCVVRHGHHQPRAVPHELSEQIGKDALVTDHDTEWSRRTIEDDGMRAGLQLGNELGPAAHEPEHPRQRYEFAERNES